MKARFIFRIIPLYTYYSNKIFFRYFLPLHLIRLVDSKDPEPFNVNLPPTSPGTPTATAPVVDASLSPTTVTPRAGSMGRITMDDVNPVLELLRKSVTW